ncbi:hypothetical protein BDQ12DRAFT_676712 [Crucibulum laeve]|uniref:Fe2OG dioxygenase domain-containing protein n=1 Tax=Crucibulum laeve TaxID=68775 RepID=A0A5C3MFT1_9AGAR|nr:hypothetical protein BDQ12DRAFT_676712 [Crucibulum laeve]
MDSNDTDTLLALVLSLLNDQIFNTDRILDALVQCDGDAVAAANMLNGKQVPLDSEVRKGKRKRIELDSWLKTARPNTVSNGNSPLPPPTATLRPISKPGSSSIRVKPTSKSESKPVDLSKVLKQPPSMKKAPIGLPPLLLSSPSLVAEYTPCTLHLSVLPPELACKLFYIMVDASRKWSRNKWWLFDRVVESPHRTSFYARKHNGVDGDETWQEAAQYWYNGRATETPETFPPEMEDACKVVEEIVNEEMNKRRRFKLEWKNVVDGEKSWRANVAASNCYEGTKESVGLHSDQLTYLGPYPTIASISLGTRRLFSLREVIPAAEEGSRKARTFNIPLPHNSLTIMHASCQEKFKHSIPPQSVIDMYRPAFSRSSETQIEPSNCRINITFRFYRPDFHPASIPRCKCGVPTILRPDMRNRSEEETDRYWWTCYAGAQNEGKGCNFWKVMDIDAEGRGKFTATI